MKTKLTVTIDAELVPRAKQYARMQGVSLSQLIETALWETCAEARPTFSQRLRGKFQVAQRGDERYQQLARKYL